jgi:hypothetical protein
MAATLFTVLWQLACPDDDWPLVIPQGWRGFALLGNQSYVLRINIETIMSLGPEELRQLLAYNAR